MGKHINQNEYCNHVKQFILASANSYCNFQFFFICYVLYLLLWTSTPSMSPFLCYSTWKQVLSIQAIQLYLHRIQVPQCSFHFVLGIKTNFKNVSKKKFKKMNFSSCFAMKLSKCFQNNYLNHLHCQLRLKNVEIS